MKASDFVFCVDITNDPDCPSFCITSQEYWNENECICDGQEDEEIEKHLPDRFHNLMEGTWEYAGSSWQEGKQKLLDAGFVYNDALHEFINNYNPNGGCGDDECDGCD
jgi:hypothetical protein